MIGSRLSQVVLAPLLVIVACSCHQPKEWTADKAFFNKRKEQSDIEGDMVKMAGSMIKTPPSYYNALIKKPTGKNGFEDYLRAIDAMSDKDVAQAHTSILSLESNNRLSDRSSIIKLERTLRDRSKTQFALVASGNKKPFSFPADINKLEENGIFFETLSRFKNLTREASMVADADFADHEPKEATMLLIDQLRMSYRLSQINMICDLVGIAIDAIVLKEFRGHFQDLDAASCRLIVNQLNTELSQTPPLSLALLAEVPADVEAIKEEISEAPQMSKEDSNGSQDRQENIDIAKGLMAMPLQQRQHAGDTAIALVTDYIKKCSSTLASEPEAKWPWPTDPLPTFSLPFATSMGEFMWTPKEACDAEARSRIQLRLLRVHALIRAFRLKEHRLPASLDELHASEALHDPLSGGELVYVATPNSYSLYSRGRGDTGSIEVVYRRPQSQRGSKVLSK